MNGAGKLRQDPSAPGEFSGHSGDLVSLALRSNLPVAFVSATYTVAGDQIETLSLGGDYLRFTIRPGAGSLSFLISRTDPEQRVELVEATEGYEHNLAILETGPAYVFTILGE